MHRHGYQGRKFGRQSDERRALMKGLMCALIEHTSIRTTLPKAKELRPFAEKLITRARKGGLFNRRLIIARIGNVELGGKLVDVIAPQVKRESGYLKIAKLESRRGDNALMAEVSFVDEIKIDSKETRVEKPKTAKAKVAPSKSAAKKPAVKTVASPKKAAAKTTTKKGDK